MDQDRMNMGSESTCNEESGVTVYLIRSGWTNRTNSRHSEHCSRSGMRPVSHEVVQYNGESNSTSDDELLLQYILLHCLNEKGLAPFTIDEFFSSFFVKNINEATLSSITECVSESLDKFKLLRGDWNTFTQPEIRQKKTYMVHGVGY